ncbi:MAG: hypothetical protein KF819_17190 [Labilithrix sp.]|nr:hypothetical protein [Labilithrix sp.]
MDKVAIRVSGEKNFFEEVRSEAARLDRSPSWLLAHCVGAILPRLASSIVVAGPLHAKGEKPKASEQTFFVPRDLVETCGKLAARLGMSSDDVLAYAWLAGRDGIRAMPSS